MTQAHRWEMHSTRPNPYAYIRYMPDMRLGGGFSKGAIHRGEAPTQTRFSANTGAGSANWDRPASIGAIDPAGKPFGNPFTEDRAKGVQDWRNARRTPGANTAPIQKSTSPVLGQGPQPSALNQGKGANSPVVAPTAGPTASNMFAFTRPREDRMLPAGAPRSASRGNQRALTTGPGALPYGGTRSTIPPLPSPGGMLALPAGPQPPGSRLARRTNFSIGG